jgi:transcriptional regulator NrdR family protein
MITEFGCPNCGSSDYECAEAWEWTSGNTAEQQRICQCCHQAFVARIGPVDTRMLVTNLTETQPFNDVIYNGMTREQLISRIANREIDGLALNDIEHMVAQKYRIWPDEEIISRYQEICE